jgi:hypothetical protein
MVAPSFDLGAFNSAFRRANKTNAESRHGAVAAGDLRFTAHWRAQGRAFGDGPTSG